MKIRGNDRAACGEGARLSKMQARERRFDVARAAYTPECPFSSTLHGVGDSTTKKPPTRRRRGLSVVYG